MARAAAISPATEVRVNHFLAQVYLIMSLGLVITALVAAWVSTNLRLQFRIAADPWFAWGLFIVQIMVVAALSAVAMRLKPAVAALLFFFYSALTGLTLSSILLVYNQEQIAYVFWITAGTFFLTSLFGLLLKRDLSAAGNVLFMLLLGWTLAWFLSWLFPFSNTNWLLTFLGIALFVGLTAHDTQKLKQIGARLGEHPAQPEYSSGGGLAVLGALTLYLDFINLFLLMLRASRRR
jgi:FtsH-binding integral membrane protein